ncbi:hypothetical protein LLH06_11990 [Mucilaginibacter daejeonensis]|uniref:hypothetical protein n=1 Tax=Mucilaginibacter daejeonensis TaxID=398049 RepID=UPI001D17D343|nr:hypothetical protein [Mucilaginibacter daejeonensis]UEG51690.1 hypothetical protein LLH06_11990 [Mucilaginibacter daejeonensis]
MSNDNNMAPGQQNFPSKEDPQGNPHRRSTEEIVEGARTEDQLDEFKSNAPKGGTEHHEGAAPGPLHPEKE